MSFEPAPRDAGKTTLSRQVAQCVSAGVWPITHRPKRTLLIDLEKDDE